MKNEIQIWNKVLTTALNMPGVAINRQYFLQEKLAQFCTSTQISQSLEKGTIGIVPFGILDEIAKECIKYHTAQVTVISTAMGIPGGWWALGTVPGDLAQYFYHVFVLSQKLAYIYGYPDFCDEKGNITEEGSNMLTVFVGVMGGVAVANKAIQELAEQLQKQVLLRLPQKALTKGVIYPFVKQIAKWIGVKLTRESFAKGLSKVVPILGGLISGGLTYFTFKPQSQRLMMGIKSSMMLAYENRKSEQNKEAEDIPFEEI